MPATQSLRTPPISDAIIIAVSRLVDDAQTGTREPSHSDIEHQINRAGLKEADPKTQGQTVGKAKRVRSTLSWALENDSEAGCVLVSYLVAHLKGCGGFRKDSPNYVGQDSFRDAVEAFRQEGYLLAEDGDLRPVLLDNLSPFELTCALEAYVRRAKRGASDAALVTGTGKDLLEATAAHVLTERWGNYPANINFPMLLGQAFTALDLATPGAPGQAGEPAQRRLERAMYEIGCAVNNLRNREGTGHGRPWLPTVTENEARIAIELMGIVAEKLLVAHREKQ